MNQEEQGRKISELIAKCWADEGFKQKGRPGAARRPVICGAREYREGGSSGHSSQAD